MGGSSVVQFCHSCNDVAKLLYRFVQCDGKREVSKSTTEVAQIVKLDIFK